MKKIIFIVTLLLTVFGVSGAFAQEEIEYATAEAPHLPKTYVEEDADLFSNRPTLEQVLVDGWDSVQTQISVERLGISISDFVDMYQGVLYNNPEFYYVTGGFRYSYNTFTRTVLTVWPEYSETNTSVIKSTRAAIDAETDKIMLYLDENMTDFEKIMTVHDYMVLHYDYDYTYSNYDITIMTTKTGVCMAYAYAFKHLMNQLDIECLFVSSEEMDHAWNLVEIDGKWYHIDLTWDDNGAGYYGQISHEYALLSDYEIQHIYGAHYGYDSGGQLADSDRYDNAVWHYGTSPVVSTGKDYFYVDDNNILDQNGTIIYQGLNGGDGRWDLGDGSYYRNNKVSLAVYNGNLYFNTDKSVLSYNPRNKKISKVLDYSGICGLIIENNTLEYCKYDKTTKSYVKAGSYQLGKIHFGGTFHKDNKIIKRFYKDSTADNIYVYADCENCTKLQVISASGVSKVSFDCKDCQTIFFWDDNMRPLKEKEFYTN